MKEFIVIIDRSCFPSVEKRINKNLCACLPDIIGQLIELVEENRLRERGFGSTSFPR